MVDGPGHRVSQPGIRVVAIIMATADVDCASILEEVAQLVGQELKVQGLCQCTVIAVTSPLRGFL